MTQSAPGAARMVCRHQAHKHACFMCPCRAHALRTRPPPPVAIGITVGCSAGGTAVLIHGSHTGACVGSGGPHLERAALQRLHGGQEGRHHVQHRGAKAGAAVVHAAAELRTCMQYSACRTLSRTALGCAAQAHGGHGSALQPAKMSGQAAVATAGLRAEVQWACSCELAPSVAAHGRVKASMCACMRAAARE